MKTDCKLQDYQYTTNIQKGIIFDALRSEYSSPTYIAQTIFHIKNFFYESIFLLAFAQVIERHTQLRSAFHNKNSHHEYYQYFYKHIKVPCENHDYGNMIESEKANRFALFLEKDINTGFDLSEPPLMRLAIFKFCEDEFRVVWTRHHILLDGESVKTIVHEILTYYRDKLNRKKISLRPPSHCIQNPLMEYNNTDCQRYWQHAFHDCKNPAYLPEIVKNASPKQLKRISIEILTDKYNRLRKFVDSHHLTMNTLLEASWAITLFHYSNNPNVVFGSVRAFRRHNVDVEVSVGLFINTVPITMSIDVSTQVINFLKEIRKRNEQLKKYLFTPLAKIKKYCNLSLEQPIYQSVIDYKPESLNAFVKKNFSELNINVELRLDIPYPLMLEVIGEENGLELAFHYDESLFTTDYASLILKHFFHMLNLFPDSFQTKISDLPTLFPEDWKEICRWNKTEQDFPTNATIHKLVEQQAIKSKFAKAVVYGNQSLTYQQLNNRANQLAYDLIQIGVQIESFVAICLPSGINMIVAILGVLKAGGIYIPIDVNYPVERINYLVNDSQPKVIITDYQRIDLLKNNTNGLTQSLFYNVDEIVWQDKDLDNPNIPTQSENGMYMVYTSGSTGVPKGALVEHRSAVNMACSCISALQIDNASRILQIASFSFDVFAAEWCMTLLAGATLYLMDKDIFSPDTIVRKLRDYRISVIILASTILSVFPKEDLPALKVIACGGEPCSLDAIDFWSKNRLFLNIFGITEASVCSTAAVFQANNADPSLIGKPLANTKVFILNENGKMLPVGVSGEMCIAGIGLARHYHNNPSLTKDKFIKSILPNPNNTTEYTTLYRTGDLARWLPSGQLEFIGRKDEQIKIRGFRIETGEVEHTLEKYPSIIKAVVLTSVISGSKQLLAYALTEDKNIDIHKVKNFLKEQLPSYMIPNKIILTDHIPLTPNGKIDKEKLLSVESHQVSLPEDEISDQDRKIISIIRSILNVEQVPCATNFFDIGFDSISLVQLSAMLTQEFNNKISVVDLFTYTTIKDLSGYISKLQNYH
jgi:amino acid adenylation domain-containing protein